MKGTRAYPVGAGTYSKHPDRYADGAPRLIDSAWGAYVRAGDAEYVDLTSGMGAVILGHQDEQVDGAIRRQVKQGIAFPLPTALEEKVANQLLGLLTWPKAESVRFGKNGADVTTSAVRLARAVTGRQQVLYADYHGHHDWCMIEPPWNAGVLLGNTGSEKVPRGEAAAWVRRRVPAAIILEPYPSAPGVHEPVDWADLRRACDETGALLILDEMVSGFRAAPGGGAEALGIQPDLACYGKAIANGMPLSAIVGPYEYLKRYEEDVFFSLTHAGEALSLAAASATMEVLKDGKALQAIGALGVQIMDLFMQHGRGTQVQWGYPQRLLFPGFGKKELGMLLDHGVLCAGYANLTLAHAEDQVARQAILDAFRAVLAG